MTKIPPSEREFARSGYPVVAIVGPDEAAAGTVTLKTLETGGQRQVPRADVAQQIARGR